MLQDAITIIPNLYNTYAWVRHSKDLGIQTALAETITDFLSEQKFAKYQFQQPLTKNADDSVTATISTKTEGNIGQITFTVNETTQEIETTYSNEILKEVFQPLFNPNYYIEQSALSRESDLAHVRRAQEQSRQFYACSKSLQFAAKIEEIHNLYEKIKKDTIHKHANLQEIGDQKILEKDSFGHVQENKETFVGKHLSEEEKIIAEIYEITQREFFRTLPTYGLDPNNSENMDMLDQRLQILNRLSDILKSYSQGILPNKNKISEFRPVVETLRQDNDHGESKTQRTLTRIGMGIGTLIFVAGVVFIAFTITSPAASLWIYIAGPVLCIVGGLINIFSVIGFYFSFPQGIAKDLYFVADKMEKELPDTQKETSNYTASQ